MGCYSVEISPGVLEIRRDDTDELVALQYAVRGSVKYSKELGDLICSKIACGKRLSSICGEEGMPTYESVMRWRREHDEFRESYAIAERDRACYFADKVVALAESNEVSDPKMAAEAYKWAAKVGNMEKYSDKQNLQLDSNAGQIFILNTGIVRRDDGKLETRDVTASGEQIGSAENNTDDNVDSTDTVDTRDTTETIDK